MNARGFNLVELMVATAIMALAGAATIRFFSDSQRTTRTIEGRLEAASETARIVEQIRSTFRQGDSAGVLSLDANGRTISFTTHGVTFRNTCDTMVPSHRKRRVPALVGAGARSSAAFDDCPARCPAGQRPVVEISKGGKRSYFPQKKQTKFFGAAMCIRETPIKRYSYAFNDTPQTNPPKKYYNVYVFVAHDVSDSANAKDHFLWAGQGTLLTPSLTGLVNTK